MRTISIGKQSFSSIRENPLCYTAADEMPERQRKHHKQHNNELDNIHQSCHSYLTQMDIFPPHPSEKCKPSPASLSSAPLPPPPAPGNMPGQFHCPKSKPCTWHNDALIDSRKTSLPFLSVYIFPKGNVLFFFLNLAC